MRHFEYSFFPVEYSDIMSPYAGITLIYAPALYPADIPAHEAKAQKVKAEGILRSTPKDKEASEKPAASKTNSTYKAPNSPFINQSKVEKRPLSKNVYQKKIAVPKEEPKGPVTIISKPEKDSHVGIIVTIIMTIILGATAGTVAFLLLPK